MDFQGFGQNVVFFLGFVAEVVTHSAQLDTFGPNGIYGVVVALDQLVPVQSVELGLFHRGLEGRNDLDSVVSNRILPKSIYLYDICGAAPT